MSCLNNRRMKDVNHVIALAAAYGKSIKKDIDIIKVSKSGIGEVYDFIETDQNKQEAVKTISFVRKDSSPDILQDSGSERISTIKTKRKDSKSRTNRKPLVQYPGTVLQADKPVELSSDDKTNDGQEPLG